MNDKRKSVILNIVLYLVISLGITLLAVACQPNSFRDMVRRLVTQPLLLGMNVLPIFLLTLALGALFGNVFLAGSLVNLVVCGMSIASRIKIDARDEALLPRDFLLLREVGEAVNSYDIDFPWKVILVVALCTVILAVLGVLCRRKWPRTGKWPIRILIAAVAFGTLAGLTVTVYASEELYYSFDCTNSYYESRTYNEYGMPYSFLHHVTVNLVDCPEGYDRVEAEGWDQGTDHSQGPQVHLIMVMSEAFSDLTDQIGIDGEDPLQFFHSLQQQEHTISGRVVVPNFGGGTANTEFDVLTGMQTDSLGAGTTTAFTAVKRNLDSLFRVYDRAGYRTSFIHPGYRWFYNRENTYERLGARSSLFYEDMTDKEMKGTWVTDDYVMERIISDFEHAVSEGEMLYNYTTTVQNHMAYTLDKYGSDYELPELKLSENLSQSSRELLSVYTEGIRDADRALEKLVSYFAASPEPVVLAFWGDHYPNLGGSLSVYNELGLIENQEYPFQYYATPYVVWANDAAARELQWEEAAEQLGLPENGYLSACYFGSMLLELCGRGQATPYVNFLNELRRELPVVWNGQCCLDGAGNLLYELDETQQKLISKWRCWSYYRMMEKEIGDE